MSHKWNRIPRVPMRRNQVNCTSRSMLSKNTPPSEARMPKRISNRQRNLANARETSNTIHDPELLKHHNKNNRGIQDSFAKGLQPRRSFIIRAWPKFVKNTPTQPANCSSDNPQLSYLVAQVDKLDTCDECGVKTWPSLLHRGLACSTSESMHGPQPTPWVRKQVQLLYSYGTTPSQTQDTHLVLGSERVCVHRIKVEKIRGQGKSVPWREGFLSWCTHPKKNIFCYNLCFNTND